MPFINPEREVLFDTLAESFSYGQTFISTDVAVILPDYGYSPDSARTYAIELLKTTRLSEALVIRGVSLAARKYRGIQIYLDGNLAEQETDIDKTLQRIDEYWAKAAQERSIRQRKVS